MRFTIASDLRHLNNEAVAMLEGYYGRVFLHPEDPRYQGGARVLVVEIIGPDRDAFSNTVQVRLWDERDECSYGDVFPVIADRIHIPS